QNILHELHVKLQNKEEKPEEEVKDVYEGYMGSIVAGNGEGQGLVTNNFSEDFSKVGFFNPPDVKIFEISRNVNDNHIILLQGRVVYLRCTCLEVLEGGSWSLYTTNTDPKATVPDSYFFTEDNTESKEADFLIRINTLVPIDAKILPEYVDYFYIGSDSKFGELDLTESSSWNLQEMMFSNGASDYSYAYNMVPRKRDVEWTDSYLKEVYETCLYVPEETRKSLLECGKLPEWYLELLEDPSKMTTAEKVARVVDYVRNLHPYSKDTPYPPEGADFVTWFITESRSGFCVHYATTAAVLLRMIDVPTRYVSGYYADTDPGGKPTQVSMTNAHAWFEFFDPDYGWVLDDPTPGNNVVASYFNAYAIAKEYGDMVYDFQYTPTPSPVPVHTVTPVPEEIEEEGGSSMSGVVRVLVTILSILLVIGAIRLGYVLFWKLRLRNKTANEKASVYNSYYKMHLYILEGKGSRAVKKIVDKAEYSRDTISEKELSYIIRFGEHNLEKQKKGASRLRKAISYILRVRFQDKGAAAESATEE
ncbi:MAG: transglutaminase domain-containing protein, partial [Clostridiales bacterium]|nr:transglutaminase domain-containing protein [Clostridiales bacterium]